MDAAWRDVLAEVGAADAPVRLIRRGKAVEAVTVVGEVPIDPTGSLVNLAIWRFMKTKAKELGIHSVRNAVKFVPKAQTTAAAAGKAKDMLSVPDEELVQLSETPELLRMKVEFVADAIREAQRAGKEFVIHTGAGISTAANIPDFRGPNGVWTCRDRGRKGPAGIAMEQAIPTFAHRCIRALHDSHVLSYLVSQNVDGLHRRSGIPAEAISELHGNCFKESCATCNQEYLRCYDVKRHRGPHFRGVQDTASQSGIPHITGRKCGKCGTGMLRDTIIHFKENLPEEALRLADKHSRRAGVALVLGSSLHVTPAADLPESCSQVDGKMVVVSLQSTGRDGEALQTGGVLIHAKCDQVMEALMAALGTPMPNTPEAAAAYAAEFEAAVRAEAEAAAAAEPVEPPKPVPRAGGGIFADLGLPSTMAQLPPAVHIRQACKALPMDASGRASFEWALSLALPDGYPLPLTDYVQAVEFQLHPTFDPAVVKVDAAPFQLTRVGWGTFDVGVAITFREGFGKASEEPLKATHKLQFELAACETVVPVPRMTMPAGFLSRLTGAALRPTETRVRRADGSTFIEERSTAAARPA